MISRGCLTDQTTPRRENAFHVWVAGGGRDIQTGVVPDKIAIHAARRGNSAMDTIDERAKELRSLLNTQVGARHIVGLYAEKVLAPDEPIPNGMLVETMIDGILEVEFRRPIQQHWRRP